MLPHPPYSPDLAQSDFQLLGPLKDSLGGLKYKDDQQHVLKFFHTSDKDFYATGFRRLVESWETLLICREIMLKNYKTVLLLLFTVIFLKELVLELIEHPSLFIFIIYLFIHFYTLKHHTKHR